jgi:Holliday junction resolvasome RuvABC DNA-binding subunit
MSELKPHDFDMNLYYLCPDCGGDNPITLKEVQQIGVMLCCCCNAKMELKYIDSITVHFKKKKQSSVVQEKSTQPSINSNDAAMQVVATLKNLGCRASQAKKLVQQGIGNGLDIDNPEEFIAEVLKY